MRKTLILLPLSACSTTHDALQEQRQFTADIDVTNVQDYLCGLVRAIVKDEV